MKDRASIYTIYFKYKLDFNKYKSLTQVASGFSYLAQKQSDSSRYELWVLKENQSYYIWIHSVFLWKLLDI